ncbi:MAG: flagellar biosynthesis anti-sigma factor FlgM [Deltaproteobacteria bacterium]|nr:flagellar biosynthesis anti-sigma factor FlgM [Deltaproteobacteria bacterium]
MKIDNNKVNDLLTAIVRKTDVHAPKVDAQTKNGQEAIRDKVEISTKNELVSNLVDKVKKVPDVRQEKVQMIKEAVLKGEYKTDAQNVARNLLREGIINEIV